MEPEPEPEPDPELAAKRMLRKRLSLIDASFPPTSEPILRKLILIEFEIGEFCHRNMSKNL
jgi:hypothetical protein